MRELRCSDLDDALAAHQAQGFRLDTIRVETHELRISVRDASLVERMP